MSPKHVYKTRQKISVLKMVLQKQAFYKPFGGGYIHVKTKKTPVLLTRRRIRRGADSSLASSWLSSGPGSGPRAGTGARSWCRPGPGTRWGVCLPHFFLNIMGRRWGVGVLSRGRRLRLGPRSPPGLSPGPLPVPDKTNSCKTHPPFCLRCCPFYTDCAISPRQTSSSMFHNLAPSF